MRSIAFLFSLALAFGAAAPVAAPAKDLDRTVLPIAEPKIVPITIVDARDAKAPPRFEVREIGRASCRERVCLAV